MLKLKELYHKFIYGVMGTLIFHILIVFGFLIAELNLNVKIEKEESILIDFSSEEEKDKILEPEKKPENELKDKSIINSKNEGSNRAVNDASKEITTKDKFFDENYNKDIEEAKKMVADVNKQLSKKTTPIKKFEMPEATTEGQNKDSIKNVIYSGKSNIHYFLENRYHIRLPIPVYLAKSGGEIIVDIQVDRSGKVIKALARLTKNISDPMLSEYATQAAERTQFNTEAKAPAIQRGTITYKFVAQ